MNTKLKKFLVYVLPPLIFLLLGFIFRIIWNNIFGFDDLKYLSYETDLIISLVFGAIASLLYLVALWFTSNSKTKVIPRVIVSALIIVVFGFEFFCVIFSGVVSETDDARNYLDFDNCGLESQEFFDFMLSEIPENAQNIIYSYQYRDTIFGGAYAYAEWTLPDDEYQAEKQRLTDLLSPRIPHEIDGETVYENWKTYATQGQISFNDSENKVSYYISSGEEIGNKWKKDITD